MISEISGGNQIGLALSGGGIRAMAFHSGVLHWLAEAGQLNKVAHISSVSGGSLLIGLILRLSNWRWPFSEEYKTLVLPQLREFLPTKDIAFQAMLRLLRPTRWNHVL